MAFICAVTAYFGWVVEAATKMVACGVVYSFSNDAYNDFHIHNDSGRCLL